MITEPKGTKRLSALRSLWEAWKRVAKRIGDLQVRGLLILFYFSALAPFALAVRWWSDPLAIKAGTPRGWWLQGDEASTPMERARRQF
jgi:hypothetical protein